MTTKLLLFNKPFDVLSQFSDSAGHRTLKNFLKGKKFDGLYPAGRLDKDSEGLMLLTNNGSLQNIIAHPENKLAKTYLVQVEGIPEQRAINQLELGLKLKDGITLPAKAAPISTPKFLWPRTPPIRYRKNDRTTWLELTIIEGKNRQVRRMTAAIGHPTLRLIRKSIGNWSLGKLQPGDYCFVSAKKLLAEKERIFHE